MRISGCRRAQCPWNVGMQVWEKHPRNIGMHELTGTGQDPKFGCHPPQIPAGSGALLPLEPSWGALHSLGAKVTPAGAAPSALPAWNWIGSSLELLESQHRREKLLGWDGVSGVRGTDVALLGSGCLKRGCLVEFGAADAQGRFPSVSRVVGTILKDIPSACCCGAFKRRGKSRKSQTPMLLWVNHKMLQSSFSSRAP